MNTKVLELIKEVLFLPEEFKLSETTKISELNMDDLDFIELLIALEAELNILIDDDDAEKWKTVKDLNDYVTQLLLENNPTLTGGM